MSTAAPLTARLVALARNRRAGTVLSFLGSMRLAVSLLVVLGIASVIGTVLQQNQPYADYLEKFGPFWFEAFRRLGLFDVYSAAWFLAILAALVASTSVCLWRRTPGMLAQMHQYREHHQAGSLRAFRQHREWIMPLSASEAETGVGQVLRRHGYRVRRKRHGDATLLAGLSGRSNRLGYVALHLAIVVIAIGGLLDGNLGLKFREWRGQVVTETRPLPVTALAAESRLAPGRGAFRGTVTIPEGERASVAFLQLRDGYVVRELPFELRLEAFRVSHYDSGEPRSYESDVVLTAPELAQRLRRTIRVNEPLHHAGYAIYQAGFGDGGSSLNLRAWPLAGGDRTPRELEWQVFREQPLAVDGGLYHLELADFEAVTVQPAGIAANGRTTVRKPGPRFRYRLRDTAGERLEFETYMLPMEIDGRRYFVSGVRHPGATDFRYLHIPADHRDSPARFTALAGLLSSPDRLRPLVDRAVRPLTAGTAGYTSLRAPELATVTVDLVATLAAGGQPAMDRILAGRLTGTENVAPSSELLEDAVDAALTLAYRAALAESGDDPTRPLDENDAAFLRHSLATIPALDRYGAPVFLQLTDFRQRQASTLEITRSPGKPVVYVGFLLLTVGVFLSFFVPYRRAWGWIRERGDGTTLVLLAGTSPRDHDGYARHFLRLTSHCRRRLSGAGRRDDSGSRG